MHYETLSSVALAVLLTLGVSYLAYSYALKRTGIATHLRRKGYSRCPHYQHVDIFFGSDWQKALRKAAADGVRAEWYREQFAKYGKTFETKVGGRLIFQTCDAVNAQSLLTGHTVEVGVGPSRAQLIQWLGPGAFTADGELWKKSRDMLKPVFRKTAISDMTRLDKHLSRMLLEVEKEGPEVDLQTHFVRMAKQFLDFSMDLLIGEDVNTVSKDFSKVDANTFIDDCDKAQLHVVRSMSPWPVQWWRGWTKDLNQPFDATQSFVDRYVRSAVQDAETKSGGPIPRSPALLDEMIREAGSKDLVYLRNQVLNVFMPGRDSVAIMMSHVMFRLARHPAAYQKVRAEVLAAGFEHTPPSYDAIKNLEYTNAVLNEALRLGGPPNGQTARDVLSDLVLPRGGGVDGDQPILVPKNSIVYVQIQTIHRDEDAWGPDPHAFRPERWLESSKMPQRLAFEYIPFGAGRRICPANALVMGELAYILATFALRFREIQNRDPEQRLFEKGAIVMKIRNGVQVKLVK